MEEKIEEKIENKEKSKEKSKVKIILKNVLIVFAVCFIIIFVYQLYQDYEYYSVYDKEDLKEWFSMSETILWDLNQAFSWSFVLGIVSIPILSIMQFVSKKNIIRIVITIVSVLIIAFIYIMANLTIQF